MKSLKNEFVSNEVKHYKFQIGKTLASSLAGFLAGIATTLIVIMSLFDLVFRLK
jgi:hypothetical protein